MTTRPNRYEDITICNSDVNFAHTQWHFMEPNNMWSQTLILTTTTGHITLLQILIIHGHNYFTTVFTTQLTQLPVHVNQFH